MPLLDTLGEYVAGFRPHHLPARDVEEAKLCLLDTIGAIFVGDETEIGETINRLAPAPPPAGGASVLTTGAAADLETAAGINASMAHCAEIDNIHPRAIVCVGSLVVPAALACAEAWRLPGEALLAAVALGCEVAIRLGCAARGEQFLSKGWWPTALFGPMGVAALAAWMRGLPAQGAKQALAVCSTLAGGLINGGAEGATARHFLSGWAARAGLASAGAARCGFTGPDEGLEEAKGLYAARGVEPDFSQTLTGLGETWHLSEILYKGYASCMQGQAGVHGFLKLTGDLGPEDIGRVTLALPKKALVVVTSEGAPGNHTAAGAHGPYLLATALTHRQLLPAQFSGEALRDGRTLAFMKKIEVVEDPALEAYGDGWPARVTLVLTNGDVRKIELAGWMGDTFEEKKNFVVEKFRNTMAATRAAGRAERVLACVQNLEEQGSVDGLVRAATGRPRE